MKSPQYLPGNAIIGGLALALALMTVAPSAHANVFASSAKINGGMTNVSVAQGTSVNISYILNEPASAGVTINVLSGATAVRTISLAGGGAGAMRGLNTVVWDGKDNSSNIVPGGNYSISITAASSGYSGWTLTTDDNNDGNYSYYSSGIAVDRNTSSPYYGRVFVSNSYDNSSAGTNYGDYVGIQKLNADGSYADEGGFSTGGVAWRGGGFAPWKIRVSDDDYVYVEDFSNAGDLYRFDGTISSNSMLHAFAPPNDYSMGQWSGFCLVGKGTNTVLWAADSNYAPDFPPSLGIEKFSVQPDGTFDATNGTQVVAVGGSPGLNVAPYAVALDNAGAIYTIQSLLDQGDPSALVFRFPSYDPATNGGAPELTADWVAGPGDDYCGGHGIAVDPTGTYVAAAFWGYGIPETSGNIKIFNATNGTVVTNLDLGVAYTNNLTSDPTHHMDTDADWDAVGNLYYLDDWPGVWRAVSPPGANQATTVALPVMQVSSSGQPLNITGITVSGGTVTIHFTAGSSDTAEGFVLLSASAAQGPYLPAAGSTITRLGPGLFQATVSVSSSPQYYRIERTGTGPVPLQITSLRVAGGTVTIDFTGAPSDSPSALTLLSSASANGSYSAAAGASIIQVSPGLFRATVPANAPMQFYRIVRSGSGTIPLQIASLRVAGGTVAISFTGATSDSPSALTLLSSTSANGSYSAAAGATITLVSPGLFQATAPTNGPTQFYRIGK
jgi:hypothetical protein